MRVLVTGATGFVGQHVARRLRQTSEVVVLVRDPEKESRVLGEGYYVVPGNLLDEASIARALQGVDVVYHIAARRDHWGRPYSEYYGANVTGTQNLLDAARAAGTRKIVHCSSVGVYGYDFEYRPVDEAHPFGKKLNYYHETKKLADELVLKSDLPIVTVRPGWIYGPNDDNGGVVQMLLKIARGRFAIVGSGKNRLHPVYIDDVVNGTLAAGDSEAYGDAFLLLGPEVTTFAGYVESMARALGVAPPGLHIPRLLAVLACLGLEPAWTIKNKILGPSLLGDKPPLTRDSLAVVGEDQVFDTSKAERILGHAPKVSIDDGLRRTVAWLASTGRLPTEIAARVDGETVSA